MEEIDLKIGMRVLIPSSLKRGCVRFIGQTEFADGEWIGVELDTPEGKNNGSVNGTVYFECRDAHGLFLKRSQCKYDVMVSKWARDDGDAAVFSQTVAEIGKETQQDTEQFWMRFGVLVQECRGRFLDATTPDKQKELRVSLASIQEFATNSSHFLVAYDVKRSQSEIEKLAVDIRELENKQPRKKFTFKSRGSATVVGTTTAGNLPVSSTSTTQRTESTATCFAIKSVLLGSISLIDVHKENRVLTKPDITQESQIYIKHCTECVFSIPAAIGSVRLEDLESCELYLGPCATSVYLESCKNCIVFLSSHQLRIHNSHECILYVRVNTHPIIEDCSKMTFGPYLLNYDGISGDFKSSGLETAAVWDHVVDFKWHRSTPSPNWIATSKQEILTEEAISPWVLSTGVTLIGFPDWAEKSRRQESTHSHPPLPPVVAFVENSANSTTKISAEDEERDNDEI